MVKKRLLHITFLFIFLLITACAPFEEPEPHTTQPSSPTPIPQEEQKEIILEGISCPENFQSQGQVKKNIHIIAGGTLKLQLGSTPSLPCNWGKPQFSQAGAVKQIDHYQTWPAEGVTPKPGAPGKEMWVFQVQEKGKTTLTLPCYCLNEAGSQSQLEGELEVKIQVHK